VVTRASGAGRFRPQTPIVCILLFTLALAAEAPCAYGETVRHGGTLVRFHANLAPSRLPRHQLVPVSLHLSIHVRASSGAQPPATRSIVLALNRGGRFDRAGLPSCDPRHIRGTSTRQALLACSGALIGSGSYLTRTVYPEGSVSLSRGTILAFNATSPRGPAILAHLYSPHPASTAHLLYFHLGRHATAPYGTVLSARLPASLDPNGSLLSLGLRLHRTYTYRGAPHSYLAASCPAPAGIFIGAFPLARASIAFADHSRVTATDTATCRVRRGASG
jgi:hypothetical protein